MGAELINNFQKSLIVIMKLEIEDVNSMNLCVVESISGFICGVGAGCDTAYWSECVPEVIDTGNVCVGRVG